MPRKIISVGTIAASIAMLLGVDGRHAFADDLKKLSGAQIRAKLAGKQFTDEVHWRDVYERDGTFRGYSMGRKSTGKWSIHGDELCLELPAPDDGCFEVTASGRRVVMTPMGNGLVIEGVIEPISDPK
ncbi:hypothetical protein [Bradyrhizobium elkanii]|uniref:hypothetical protein n=1 Tax=Bradyrhizobium elkanii TaxID=29448 RepID=UPI000842024E|nr:hypothetical protein [Bradyrhizobium elkanii]ODM71868.1 hypothetical protein A6452_06440 [Bradyrhizobium elkanii]ODM84761.1 hypothetical protein A6X20_12520 [Bradyrhizobium elkanii]